VDMKAEAARWWEAFKNHESLLNAR
jgi:hypothetical protein